MSNEYSIDISLKELGMAYRRAKVDMYYTSLPVKEKIVTYESDLYKNLKELYQKFQKGDIEWFKSEEFLGSWALDPKSIKPEPKPFLDRKAPNDIIFSNPKSQWQNIVKEDKEIEVVFRLMSDLSINFHILSTLWIQKVGHFFDEKLSSNSYGSRLRRKKDGKINPLVMGSFSNYLKPFKDWRENGIDAMRYSLESNKSIVAITADISSFFHNIDPVFFKNNVFQKIILGYILKEKEKRLNDLFIDSLNAWADITPLKRGLPVGLPASAIIANCALFELDNLIQREITPIYYGRYVDDIMLVIDNTSEFSNKEDIWEWIRKRTNGYLLRSKNKDNILFKTDYLKSSKISFGNEKNKIYILEGETGITLLKSIIKQMHNQSSEWRALPNLPSDPEEMALSILNNTEVGLDEADNLRKVSDLALCRSKFALTLRDVEAYQRNLIPHSWAIERKAFLKAFTKHVLVLPVFFEFYRYFPRVIQIATACKDFIELKEMLNSINTIIKTLNTKENNKLTIKSLEPSVLSDKEVDEIKICWVKNQKQYIKESIISSFPLDLNEDEKIFWNEKIHSDDSILWLSIDKYEDLHKNHSKFFNHDLAMQPFKQKVLPYKNPHITLPKKLSILTDDIKECLVDDVIKGIKNLSKFLPKVKKNKLILGFTFASRPLSFNEVISLFYDDTENTFKFKHISKILMALRGFPINDELKEIISGDLRIPYTRETMNTIRIGISSWETSDKQFKDSIYAKPDLTVGRFRRFNTLLNKVISEKEAPDFFILPELSCPSSWFLFFAYKLQKRKISLISGIEYIHNPIKKRAVSNQIWAALSFDGFEFPYWVLYRQDKQHPAFHEESDLKNINNKKLIPLKQWSLPPVINHGGFSFSILICSELTNISYRASMRGKIDALFIIEWNKDVETFRSIVEASALDIHAYIIQCNDRKYGDSRIRAPYKDSWKRDIVRVKGGITDYYVIGEINIKELRDFQKQFRSPERPFKPIPDGFENLR